jgi:hypothetical protein
MRLTVPKPRQAPRQRGEHRAVGPIQPRSRVGPTQHRDLAPQHHQFDVLRGRGPAVDCRFEDATDEGAAPQPGSAFGGEHELVAVPLEVSRVRSTASDAGLEYHLARMSLLSISVSVARNGLALFLEPEFSQAVEKSFHYRPDGPFVCGSEWDAEIVYLKARENGEDQFCVSLRVR